ncbi:MAG: transposase family protein [Microcoleaceae cyanobacterium]
MYRPYDDDKQKKYYSEKKKNHTLKNQIITTERGAEIVDVIVGKRGPESDVNLLIKQKKI